jgi:hypothetical protein
MREGCKSLGASKARGSGARERRHGEIPTKVGRRGGDDFWQIRQCRAGRDGPSTRTRGLREKGGGGAGWAERPGGPASRWADWAECEGKILFRIKFDF